MKTNASILQNNQIRTSKIADLLVLRGETQRAERSLKTGKSQDADKDTRDLLQQGGEEITIAFIALCHRVWECKEWSQQ